MAVMSRVAVMMHVGALKMRSPAAISLLGLPLLALILVLVLPAPSLALNEDAERILEDSLNGEFGSGTASAVVSQGWTAILGAAFALLCLLGTVIFLLVRCYCMCSNDEGCCPAPAHTGNRQFFIFALKVTIVVLTVSAVMGCVLSILGTMKMITAIRAFKDDTLLGLGVSSLRALIDSMENLLQSAVDMTSVLQLGESGGGISMDQVGSILAGVRTAVDDSVEYVETDVDDLVELALTGINGVGIAVGALVMAVVLIGCFGAVTGVRRMMGCAMCVVPVWLVLAWILFGLFSIMHLILDIVCDEVTVVAEVCQFDSLDARCEENYLWESLNEVLDDNIQIDQAAVDIRYNIEEEVVKEGNKALEKLYDSVCVAILKLNAIQPDIEAPGYCFERRKLLCDPASATGIPISINGCSPWSDFGTEFKYLHCTAVDDTLAATEEMLNDARQVGYVDPTDLMLYCIRSGALIGDVLFEDISALASNASNVLDTLDGGFDIFLQPVWAVLEVVAATDCPAAIDGTLFLYVGFCLIGVFLILCSLCWLIGMQVMPTSAIVPDEESASNGRKSGWEDEERSEDEDEDEAEGKGEAGDDNKSEGGGGGESDDEAGDEDGDEGEGEGGGEDENDDEGGEEDGDEPLMQGRVVLPPLPVASHGPGEML